MSVRAAIYASSTYRSQEVTAVELEVHVLESAEEPRASTTATFGSARTANFTLLRIRDSSMGDSQVKQAARRVARRRGIMEPIMAGLAGEATGAAFLAFVA